MDLFEMQLIDRGRGYAVGFALGVLQTKWRVARALGKVMKVTQEDDTVLLQLGMDLWNFKAAQNLGWPTSKEAHASAVLRERVQDILMRGYGDIFAKTTLDMLVDRHTLIAKAQIVGPDVIEYEAAMEANYFDDSFFYEDEDVDEEDFFDDES